MKKLSLLVVLLMFSVSYSQNEKPKFSYNVSGLNPKEVTIKVNGMAKEDMLVKVNEWLEEKLGNPDEVVDTEIEDNVDKMDVNGKKKKSKKLRFKGITYNAICFSEEESYKCENLEYTIQIKLYDDEYSFKPIKMFYRTPSKKTKQNINFDNSNFHDGSDKLKRGYEKVSSQIEVLFNNMNKSLFNFLTDRDQEDEW